MNRALKIGFAMTVADKPDRSSAGSEVRVARRAFGVINANVLRSPQVSVSAKALYALLTTFADEAGVCWPSNETLAAALGVSDRTIRTLLGELTEKHVIERRERYADGRQTTSLTVLVEIETSGRGEAHFPPGGEAHFLQNKTSRNKTTLSSSRCSDAAADEAFMAFYTLYPRHEAKGDGHKAWHQVTKDTHPDCIMTGLRAQEGALRERLAPDPTTGKVYCPLPATWLRARRWEDEITPRQTGRKYLSEEEALRRMR